MVWLIIGVLLLIFYSGSSIFFEIVFLNESGSIGAWCATGICIVITCIVVCYLRVKELWNIGYILGIIGIFGIIQLKILATVETPFYWKEDENFVRFNAAFGVQPVICLFSYFISLFPIGIYNKKEKNILSEIKNKLNLQIKELNNVMGDLADISNNQKSTDEVVMLLDLISDVNINSRYNQVKLENNRELFSDLFELNNKYNLNLYLENKTMLEISMKIKEISNNKYRQLTEINKSVYTRRNFKELKQILTEIK